MKWSSEEENLIITLRSKNKSLKEICSVLPHRTAKSISLKYNRLVKEGKCVSKRKFWTEKELNLLIDLRNQNKSIKEISEFIEHPIESIKTTIQTLIKTNDITSKALIWTDDEILDAVRKFPSFKQLDAHSKSNNIPSRSAVTRRFGSWSNALKACSLPTNVSGLNPNLPTIIYLVFFVEESFYKIGITQNSIKTRLSGYPEYAIIDFIEDLNMYYAIDLEQELKLLMKEYSYKPIVFGTSGHTECFKGFNLSSLEDIYELYR